jgi:hypothetical protein
MASLYEVAASIGCESLDGRSIHGAWGHEKQYHATRASAEAAAARLRGGGYWGCPEPPTYAVVERTRAAFPADALGEAEWRRACRQAGVAPALA